MEKGLTSRLAAFAVNTSFEDIPSDVIEKSKRMMFNSAGVGLAGSVEKEGQIIAQYVQQMGGRPECTILGKGFRSSAVNAALANGTMGHVLFYDDVILARHNHVSPTIFAVAMALGEQMALPGPKVVAAFAIGVEVSTKIGVVGDLDKFPPPIRLFGWHLTGVGSTIGATAAAGNLLGLDWEQMVNALGISVSNASGVLVNAGTSSMFLDCGRAAMNGIMVAMLAQKGFTGARNAIEAADGFLGCYRRDVNVDEEEFIHYLGNPYDVIDPGVVHRLHPCGTHNQTCVDAALHLVEEYKISPQEVQSVRVAIPKRTPRPWPDPIHPETGKQAKFSAHYSVAVALVYGQLRIHHFTDEAVKDPQVSAMIDRVTLEQTERATREAPRASTVTITLASGREVSCRVEQPKGHPSNPVTAQELEDKFRYCSRDILPPDRIENVIAQFRRIETLPDVKPLFSSLGGSDV